MENGYIIGLDIDEYESQLCCYDPKEKDAVSVMVTAGGTKAAFPTHLAYLPSEDKWKYGLEADYFIAHKGAVPVNYLFRKCQKAEEFRAEGRDFPASFILSEFIRLSLTSAGITDPAEGVRSLVITAPKISRKLAQTLDEAFLYLGFSSDQAFYQDHTESFFYHTFYQEKEVYRKEAALYHFPDDRTVSFISIGSDLSTSPATVSVKDTMSAELPSEDEKKDNAFHEFADKTISKGDYSSVFLVGPGFDRSWSKKSLALLCRGKRKVFYGNNLFAKGACYAAMERCGEKRLKNLLFIGSDLVVDNMGMEMLIEGEPGYKPLITAGIHWYEAENEIEFLLNDETEILLRTSSMKDGVRRKIKMTLPGLPERPPKTTRIRLHVHYEDANKCVIRAEDLGFGDFYPATHLVWEEVLSSSDKGGSIDG